MNKASIILDRDYQIGQIDERMKGSFVEHLGRCVYGGVYEPGHEAADANGFRLDVKEMIQELGVTAIRYPGGNFVSGYDWKDGVGPKENRPVRKDMAWNVLETNQVGTNEFARFLKECQVEMIMAGNLGTGTPKEMAELVEYCNVEGGTYWSDLRRSHGVKQPHGFALWCLGNEMDGEWQIQMHTAYEYARIAKEAAKMVKWIDPSAETIVCGTCTNEEGHTSFGEWDRIVLEETYDYVDYISLHRYYNYDPTKQLFYKMNENESDIPYFFRDLDNYLNTVISVCDFVKGKRRSAKTLHISFDEWGVITDTGAIPGGKSQEYGYASFKQLDGVIYGGLLCTFLNHADRVKIACQSLLVNEGGMITTDPSGRAIRQTTFYPFQDVARYAKGKALRCITQFPTAMTDHHGEQETLVAAAVYHEAEGEVIVFASNLDQKQECELSLDMRMFGPLQGIVRRELYAEDPYAKNTFENDQSVVPAEYALADPVDGKIAVVLKEHSWNVLRFRCGNEGA